MSIPMQATEMGRVTVSAKVENLTDLVNERQGHATAADVRRVEIDDVLVDTGFRFRRASSNDWDSNTSGVDPVARPPG